MNEQKKKKLTFLGVGGPKKDLFPMRINKYLAFKGITTRRGADELISKKKVFINGRLSSLGDKVEEKDKVFVKDGVHTEKKRYFAYNKEVGVVTHSPGKGEVDILGRIEEKGVFRDIFPLGRLDKNSSGLIIITDDGRITDKLLNPNNVHEKEYEVRVVNSLRPSFKANMEKGVDIGEYVTKNSKVKILGDRSFLITISEGKKHQIRRMCEAMHNDVASLKRIRIMNIKLGKLSPGEIRPIEGEELEKFLKELSETK